MENSLKMGVPDHLTCMLRTLYASQEATVRTGHETGSKLGKEYIKSLYCQLAYLTSMQSTSSKILGWINHKLESRLLGEITTSNKQMKVKVNVAQSCLTLCNPMD